MLKIKQRNNIKKHIEQLTDSDYIISISFKEDGIYVEVMNDIGRQTFILRYDETWEVYSMAKGIGKEITRNHSLENSNLIYKKSKEV